MPHRQLNKVSPPISTDRAAASDCDLTVVDRVKQFSRGSGVYEVRWQDGRHWRTILVTIESHATAEQTIVDAVANQFPPDRRPNVLIPTCAWR